MPPVAKVLAAPRSIADWALSSIGLGAATASAGFAAYMVVLSPKEVASGDFQIFAQFDHRYRAGPGGPGAAAPASGPATGDPAPVPAETRTAETDPVDPHADRLDRSAGQGLADWRRLEPLGQRTLRSRKRSAPGVYGA